MIILVPPSEGKNKIKRPLELKFKNTDFKLMEDVEQVIRLLDLISGEDLRSIYGTSEEKAIAFHRQNQDAMNSRCWYAIERYTGVVYENLDWPTIPKRARNYMEKHVRILSGLFGILTPMTLIPDYKLKMNVLSLQYHWNPIITEELENEDLVIDLLPQVHRKAYNKSDNVIEVEFMVKTKDKTSTAGHYGKAVKGNFIRYLALNQVKSVDDFAGFSYDGFEWDGKAFVKEE
tara:strand:+ start:402 stop:1097 length:696 start_codon:yes stop_codon:yes gene_type:complete